MKFILGEKIGMTQIFEKDGKSYPASVIKTEPVTVVQLKTTEVDGYTAVQIGGGFRKQKNINKAQIGHLKKLGNFKYLKEERVSPEESSKYKVGDKINASIFALGDMVSVAAISKSKGFQGVVKRHGFRGGSRTHGQKHSEREPGSIGGGGRAGGRVAKGMRMAGRMGGERIKVKNLVVIGLNEAENHLFVKGAVPGRRGTLLEIRGI